MPRIRTSRRVPPLKDSDYDHEITLVDDTPCETSTQRDQSPVSEESEAEAEASASRGPLAEASSTPIVNRIPPTPAATAKVNRSESRRSKRSGHSRRDSRVSRKSVESAIDILYENERGGILCGIPLFSSKALGNLDPTAWTNAAHKPSLTDTKTATVPDPSWEWAWPEWKVNHDDGMDQDGWEYSFMFCRKFSWHRPKWWNSFVRRRAWIRRRIRRHHGHCSDQNDDPCLLNPDYFTVRPASVTARSRSASIASRANSARDSRRSFGHLSQSDRESLERRDIENIETLLQILKRSRIDREKIEAVGNYLEHSKDNMKCLHENMHDIMALFVFQSSRQILLSRLIQIYDKTKDELQKQDTQGLQERAEHLSEAIKHADEEVRKLEYWSDIKGMAERGESVGAVDSKRGWGEQWKGLDQSGPTPLKPKSETNGRH